MVDNGADLIDLYVHKLSLKTMLFISTTEEVSSLLHIRANNLSNCLNFSY